MNNPNLLSRSLLLAATAGFAQNSAQSELRLELLPNEAWWGGAVTLGTKMPYGVAPIDINFGGNKPIGFPLNFKGRDDSPVQAVAVCP